MMYTGNIYLRTKKGAGGHLAVERTQDLTELGDIVGTSYLQAVRTSESQVSSLPSPLPKRCPGLLNKMISE